MCIVLFITAVCEQINRIVYLNEMRIELKIYVWGVHPDHRSQGRAEMHRYVCIYRLPGVLLDQTIVQVGNILR